MQAAAVEPATTRVPLPATSPSPSARQKTVAVACSLLFAFSVARVAWYGDDWLITLRTALNAAHGNGLSYNVDERVSAATHPLWLIMIIALGALTGSWVYSVIVLSVVLAAAAALVLLWRVRTATAFVFVVAVLLFSNTVLVWSTGGLEGSLAALLIIALVACWPPVEASMRAWTVWGVLAGLIALTRLDLLLLILPVLGAGLWCLRARPRVVVALAGGLLAPVLAWFGFSLLYYGSLLPEYLPGQNQRGHPCPRSHRAGAVLPSVQPPFRCHPLVTLRRRSCGVPSDEE